MANIKEYIKRIEKGEAVTQEILHLTEENEMEETMFLGLRLMEGVSKENFLRYFHKDIYEIYGKVLSKFINKGFLLDEGGFIRLTEAGIDLSNSILCEFLLD